MTAVHTVIDTSLLLVTAMSLSYNVRLWRQLRSIHQERAKQVEQALQNAVLVDGVMLPLPDDARWAVKQIHYQDKKDVPTLVLGAVHVRDGDMAVYAGAGTYGMRATRSTSSYACKVWNEYRSRLARKAIAGE